MPPPNTATRLQVDTLVEPVVKQVAKWGCESSDFDMFVDVAKHPRLHLRAALRLLDLLGKVRTRCSLVHTPAEYSAPRDPAMSTGVPPRPRLQPRGCAAVPTPEQALPREPRHAAIPAAVHASRARRLCRCGRSRGRKRGQAGRSAESRPREACDGTRNAGKGMRPAADCVCKRVGNKRHGGTMLPPSLCVWPQILHMRLVPVAKVLQPLLQRVADDYATSHGVQHPILNALLELCRSTLDHAVPQTPGSQDAGDDGDGAGAFTRRRRSQRGRAEQLELERDDLRSSRSRNSVDTVELGVKPLLEEGSNREVAKKLMADLLESGSDSDSDIEGVIDAPHRRSSVDVAHTAGGGVGAPSGGAGGVQDAGADDAATSRRGNEKWAFSKPEDTPSTSKARRKHRKPRGALAERAAVRVDMRVLPAAGVCRSCDA